MVRVVPGVIVSTLPEVCSLVSGTALPLESLPWPSAPHGVSTVGLNLHVKLTDWPGARVPLKAVSWSGALRKPAAVYGVQPVPVTLTSVSVSSPVFVSLTTIVISVPDGTGLAGVWLTVVRVVAGWMTSTLPDVCSLVSGTGLPLESVPWPSAPHGVSTVGLKMQVKLTDWPGARVPLKAVSWSGALRKPAAVYGVQPVPVTLTSVSVSSPVFVSLTTIVISVPDGTGLAGVWLTVVRVVAGWMTSTLPDTCSLVSGTAWPSESLPWPSAPHGVSTVGLNLQVKLTDWPG